MGVTLGDGFPTNSNQDAAATPPQEAAQPPTEPATDPLEAVEPPAELALASESLPAVDLLSDPVPIGEAAEAAGPVLVSAPGGEDCGLEEGLRQALQRDPAVQAALTRTPPSARSVANAVMVWDGRWVSRRELHASALEPVRRTIVAKVESATPACRQALNQGPRFITISGAADTTVLAVGSGAWRWSQLLDEN